MKLYHYTFDNYGRDVTIAALKELICQLSNKASPEYQREFPASYRIVEMQLREAHTVLKEIKGLK